MTLRKFLLASLIAAAATPAAAVTFNSASGLASPALVVSFSETGQGQSTALGGNYGGTGVSFIGLYQDYFYAGIFPNVNGAAAVNFGDGCCDATIEILFGQTVNAAVFTLITNESPAPTTIQSYLGAVLVESADVFTSTSNTTNFYGFTNSAFDRIVITPEAAVNRAALIDNLQINSVVPEPATWSLLIGGFAMTGVAMRRRKTALTA